MTSSKPPSVSSQSSISSLQSVSSQPASPQPPFSQSTPTVYQNSGGWRRDLKANFHEQIVGPLSARAREAVETDEIIKVIEGSAFNIYNSYD